MIDRLLRLDGNHPLTYLCFRDHHRQFEPITALDKEFKRTIDEIPTNAQRKAAQDRINDALAEKGYEWDEQEE